MLTHRSGSWVGLCAIALLAACSPSSEKAGSSESAETNNEANKPGAEKEKARISGIEKICALPNGKADINVLLGKYAVFSSCGLEGKQGDGGILDLDDADFYLPIADGYEIHNVHFATERGAWITYAAIDRKAENANEVRVHVRSLSGDADHEVKFFDESLPSDGELLAQRMMSFNAKVSSTDKTAIVWGYDKKGDKLEGRVVMVDLETGAQTSFKTANAISPDADVTVSANYAFILSTMGDQPLGKNEVPTQHAYQLAFEKEWTLSEAPSWLYEGAVGDVTVIPGTFDGKQALRFEADRQSDTKAGTLSIATIDGKHFELSKDAGVTSHVPAYMNDAEMHDLGKLAVIRVAKKNSPSAYIFPGKKPDSDAVTFFLTEGDTRTELATDGVSDDGGFAQIGYGGVIMYTAKEGVAVIELNGAKTSKLVVKDTEDKIHYGVNVSMDGKNVIVQGVTDTASTFQTIEIASSTATELKLPATNGNCGYDLSQMQMANGYVTAFGTMGRATQECAEHAKTAPEVLGFTPAGDGKSLKFEMFDVDSGEAMLDLSAYDRAVVTQCALDGTSCSAFIEIPPGLQAAVAPPTDSGDKTDPGTKTDPGDDKTDPGADGDGDDKPAKPAKPSKPSGDDTVDAPEDGSVIVSKHAPSTNSATPTPDAPAAPTTKTISTGGCSTAPGSTSPTGFGLAFLLGLAFLGRRRRA